MIISDPDPERIFRICLGKSSGSAKTTLTVRVLTSGLGMQYKQQNRKASSEALTRQASNGDKQYMAIDKVTEETLRPLERDV